MYQYHYILKSPVFEKSYVFQIITLFYEVGHLFYTILYDKGFDDPPQ